MAGQANYKNCQSCGMPMARDPEGGGTEADGSKSAKFCSYWPDRQCALMAGPLSNTG